MKIYSVKLSYQKCSVNVGSFRFAKNAERLRTRLLNDFAYAGCLSSSIDGQPVSFVRWIFAGMA